MRLTGHRNVLVALTALAGSSVIGGTAQAQLPRFHPSFYGSAEVDARHSQFYLLGLYVGVGGLGWSPYLNVNGYSLQYRLDTSIPSSDRTLSAVLPTLGLAYAARRSGVSFGAGYAWVDNENPGAPGAEGGGTAGPTASIGAYHMGTGRRAMRTQFLSNYNFDSRYLWARGRASVPFGRSTRHPARIGAEVVGQGGRKNGLESNSLAVGPTFEYGWTPSFRTTGVVGYKSVDGSGFPSRESAGYAKLEFSFSP
jgi:hypothetical protein